MNGPQGLPGQIGRVPVAQEASSWACEFWGTGRRWGGVLSLRDPTDKSVGPSTVRAAQPD